MKPKFSLASSSFVAGPKIGFLASCSTLYTVSRPYSLAYVSALGALGLCAVDQSTSPGQVATALALGPLIWTLCVTANDHVHKVADARTRPERTHRIRDLKVWLWILGLAALALLADCGPSTRVWAMAVASSAVGYGVTKNRPALAITLRGCAGGGLVGLGASLSADPHTTRVLAVAVIVALCDATGNLLGDVRDRQNDLTAGTMTLATTSRSAALTVCILLHLAVLFVIITQFGESSWALAMLLVGLCVATAVTWDLPDQVTHLTYLLWKYMVAAFIFAALDRLLLGVVTLAAMPCALLAYRQVHRSARP